MRRRGLLLAITGAALAIGCSLAGGALSRTSAPLSPQRLGVNSDDMPPDLAVASAAGVGLLRAGAGLDSDAEFELAAAVHLRMYPVLGLPRGGSPAADAVKIAALVRASRSATARAGRSAAGTGHSPTCL
jgi:hypothetical protein